MRGRVLAFINARRDAKGMRAIVDAVADDRNPREQKMGVEVEE